MKTILLKVTRLVLVVLLLLSCRLISVSNVSASNPQIGIEINEGGFLIDGVETISPDIKIIYFQFDLNAPSDMDVPLDFKWYHENTLILAYSGVHHNESVTATLRRDENLELPEGQYRIEVWFLNTLLTTKTFKIQK